MKNVLYSAAALAAMFFTACQQEVLEPVADGNTVTYSVNVSTAATKAIGDDVTDVNTLYYEVYRAADVANLDADPIYEGQKGIVDGKSSFELEFVKNQEFVVLFWAQNSSLAMFDVTDLREVALTTPGDSNDLNAQVFAGSDVVTNCVSAASGSVKLVRPISQLNIATNEESLYVDTSTKKVTLTSSTVTVKGIPTVYNVATKVASAPETVTYAPADVPAGTITVGTEPYTYVAMNYVGFAPEASTTVDVDFTFVTSEGEISHSVSNVPLKPNYRTNIVGNLITSTTDYNVSLENWYTPDEYVEVVTVSTAAELVAALTPAAGTTPVEGEETNIKLEGDINLNDLFASLTKAASVNYVTIPKGLNYTLDLNGYSLTGVDETTANFGLIQNNGNLTVTNSSATQSRIAVVATTNSGWGRYSAAISNNPGATLVVEGNVLVEHLGGTDMAYGIDNLTNGSIGDVKATINGATVKSTYRAIRQFLNSDSKMNELTIKAGSTVLGAENNKAVFFHDASTKANTGKLTIEAGAVVSGVYLFVTAGSTEWPVEVSIAQSSIKDGFAVVPANVPGHLEVVNNNGVWNVETTTVEEGDVITVYSANALRNIAAKVNAGENYYEGKTIKLGADIDLNNEEWVPMGTAIQEHGFMGNFDGNGYTIKNLNMTKLTPDSDNYVYAGLFGVTEGTDTQENYIKNLTIENVTIETNGHIVAAAIAYPYYTTLENITVTGDINIKGGDYTAGALAYTRRCVNAKNIAVEGNANSVIEGNKTVGGVISDIQMNGGLTANYSDFKASGVTVKGVQHVGGISGIISLQTLNGATVKNVSIVCDDNRKGIVSGSLGDKNSFVTNVSYENVTGATRIIGATYKDGYYVGQILEVAGAKAIIYTIQDGVKAVSVDELNLNGKNWQNAMDWAAGLGEGWALATIEELDAIHAVRVALNDVLEADNAENALFEESDDTQDRYISSTRAEGVDPLGDEYFPNRVHMKYFNVRGYWDVPLSSVTTINIYAPLKDFHKARAVYTL